MHLHYGHTTRPGQQKGGWGGADPATDGDETIVVPVLHGTDVRKARARFLGSSSESSLHSALQPTKLRFFAPASATMLPPVPRSLSRVASRGDLEPDDLPSSRQDS
mmetsp:Transcript_27331/g.61711  ORF Transcript_27331/g.61711 Transcript_27331/m.61711 type:complete len:106 (+) Transcript_27331:3-320(+)